MNGFKMTRPFKELADEVKETWSDETKEFHKKASAYFENEAAKLKTDETDENEEH